MDQDTGEYTWYILIELGRYVNGVRVMRLFKPVGRLSWIRSMRPVLPKEPKEQSVETQYQTLVATPIPSAYLTPYEKTSPRIFWVLGSLVMAMALFFYFKKQKKGVSL